MIDLGRRKWYFTAHSLVLGAIIGEIFGKYWVGRAVMGVARRAAERSGEGVVGASPAVVEAFLRRAYLWGGTGFVLVVLGAICWTTSRIKGETGSQALLIVLFAAYVFLLMLIE
jgi:hypothetical protein